MSEKVWSRENTLYRGQLDPHKNLNKKEKRRGRLPDKKKKEKVKRRRTEKERKTKKTTD